MNLYAANIATIFTKKNKQHFFEKVFAGIKKSITFAATIIGTDLWCNGNTPGFGPGVLGSSPSGSTDKNP